MSSPKQENTKPYWVFGRGGNMGSEVKTSKKNLILLDFGGCGTLLKDLTIFVFGNIVSLLCLWENSAWLLQSWLIHGKMNYFLMKWVFVSFYSFLKTKFKETRHPYFFGGLSQVWLDNYLEGPPAMLVECHVRVL